MSPALRIVVLLTWCLSAVACEDRGPTAPTVPLEQQFTLAPGQSATVAGTPLTIQFLRVSGDSRCPADAVCIQGGDAIVHIRVSGGASGEYELHTGNEAAASVTHAGYEISLVQLQPYPFSSRTIEPDDYRATITVAR